GEALRYLRVGLAVHGTRADDDVDLHAQRREDVRELGGDEAAAEDDHLLRQAVDAHNVLVRAVPDARLGDEARDRGARTGRDDDLVGGDLHVLVALARADAAGADEHRVAVVDVDVRGLGAAAVRLAAVGDGVDA